MSITETDRQLLLPALPQLSVSGVPQWLLAWRRSGAEFLATVGLPESSEEEWRFSNVKPLAEIAWAEPPELSGTSEPPSANISALYEANTLKRDGAIELVFVNGRFAPQLSALQQLPVGVQLGGSELLAGLISEKFGSLVPAAAAPFSAMNAAMLQDVAVLHVAAGVAVERPIHVLFLASSDKPAIIAHRLLIIAEPNAVLQVAENHVAQGQVLAVPVTEIIATESAVVDHVRLASDDGDSWHVSTTRAELRTGAQLVTHSLCLDGKWIRNDLDIALAGEHAHATLNGAIVLTGSHFCDNHTLIRHEQPKCTSHELYKHVVEDKAFGVFKGKIMVRPGAQQTDAKQTSKTLVLSDTAMMESMPALEIYADDVKCTHGSTIGPLDEEMVFYFRSRGLSLDAARHLLTYAFAADVTRRIRVQPIRQRVEDRLARQQGLPLDLRITEAGAHDEAVVD